MQYATALLALLASSGAMAAPGNRQQADKTITVTLDGQAKTSVTFLEGGRSEARPDKKGPFKTVLLELGAAVQKKDLRCQILDDQNKPIVVLRGQNTDITFADGGAGLWRFRNEQGSKVSKVICDPTFVKDNNPKEIRVALSNSVEAIQRNEFVEGQRSTVKIGGGVRYDTVELILGVAVDPTYRCQINGEDGRVLSVLRGGNERQTFADGDAGVWKIKNGRTAIGSITCDPNFE